MNMISKNISFYHQQFLHFEKERKITLPNNNTLTFPMETRMQILNTKFLRFSRFYLTRKQQRNPIENFAFVLISLER